MFIVILLQPDVVKTRCVYIQDEDEINLAQRWIKVVSDERNVAVYVNFLHFLVYTLYE